MNNSTAKKLRSAFAVYRSERELDGLSPQSPWDDLRAFPITPLSTLNDDDIMVPVDWVAAGVSRTVAKRSIKVLDFLPASRTREECAYHEEQLRRIIFAVLMLPRKTKKGVTLLRPGSWVQRSRTLVKAARWVLEHRYDATSLFKHLSIGDLADMATTVGFTKVAFLNRDLTYFGENGTLNDVPNLTQVQLAAGDAEVSYKGQSLRSAPSAEVSEQTQPFADAFVTELIPRALFISNKLGKPLLDAYEQLVGKDFGTSHTNALAEVRKSKMQAVDWRLADGSAIDILPFTITMSVVDGGRRGGSKQRIEYWPPRSFKELRQWIGYLQTANYNILAFCTGARWSEHASAGIDCLTEDFDAKFNSRTFKIVNQIGGKERTWPLVDQARDAIKVQQRLARIVGGPMVEHLWVQLANAQYTKRGGPRHVMNEINAMFVTALGLDALLGDIAPHTHRWRATIARLGAMALIEAPRILMRLFGHRNIEMTLRYIFANDDIRQELAETYATAAYAMSKELVLGANGLDGPAAPRLRSLIEEITSPSPDGSVVAQNTDEVVDILTLLGPAAKTVRPGIKCLKQPGQYGPCSMGHGAPNTARCKVSCEHRLEDEIGRRHAEEMIPVLLQQLETPQTRERPLVVASLEGALLTHLRRFSDIREHWLKVSDVASKVWNAAARLDAAS